MVRTTRVLVGTALALVLACAGLIGILTVQQAAAAVVNTRLAIAPVFSATLVGGYDQAGNGLLRLCCADQWQRCRPGVASATSTRR